nr:immunoglobulin heavy chain junction region [Macaca mulatta]
CARENSNYRKSLDVW